MRITRNYAICGLALACVVLAVSPAPAFYWTLRVVPSLVTPNGEPGNPPLPGVNPIPLPPDTSVPGGGPGTVPEPATAAAGLVGLGLLGMRRLLNWKGRSR